MDRIDGQSGAVFWFAFPYRPDFTALPASPCSELATEVRVALRVTVIVIVMVIVSPYARFDNPILASMTELAPHKCLYCLLLRHGE